ncbi:MAG TPA: protein kinase [Kofleriaceae bacterium]|nr:protein kinase [Kofleriaceae bacterium]
MTPAAKPSPLALERTALPDSAGFDRTVLPDVSVTATAAGAPLPPHAGELFGPMQAGQQLAHFRVEQQLGAGGMGEVYLGTDLALDRSVALKVLPAHLAHDAVRRERMIREARAQAQINHPNVCHIYFVGEQDRRLFFAMERIEGETFAERCAKTPVSLEDALEWVRAAACGLQAAQQRGFIHRDIKPSNLMIDAQGVVKVLDFGLVAAQLGRTDDDPAGNEVAQTSLAGTPLYMAPEQARGEKLDFRADIYSLGCTLYQLLVGRPPFVADTMAALLSMHTEAARPNLDRTVGPSRFTAPVQALIARMMAPQAADRFASYDALIGEIDQVSRRRTRPAGFLVRTAAASIDFVLLTALVVVPAALLHADGNITFNAVLFALFGLSKVLVSNRLGGSIGQRVFELEVIDVRTQRRPAIKTFAWRSALMMAPLLVAWILSLVRYLPVAASTSATLTNVSNVIDVVAFGAIMLALAISSLRAAGRRTPWDRWSHTMVRYRNAS